MTIGFWTRLAVHIWGVFFTAGLAMLGWTQYEIPGIGAGLIAGATIMIVISAGMDDG